MIQQSYDRLISVLTVITTELLASEAENTPDLIQKSLRKVADHLGLESVYLGFYNSETDRFTNESFEWKGVFVEPDSQPVFTWTAAEIANVLREGTLVENPHQLSSLEPSAGLTWFRERDLQSLYLLPLASGGTFVGFAALESKHHPVDIVPHLRAPLLLFGGVLSASIQRQRSQQRLRELDTSYRDLFQSLSDAIYIQDSKGCFVDVNRGAERMYGYPREYFIGKTPEFLSAPGRNDLAKTLELVQAAFAGTPQCFEFWGVDKSGHIFPKEVRLYPGRYRSEPAVIAYATNITQRLAHQESARRREERTLHRQRLESLGILAGGFAHDFNNLLQSILGNTELALEFTTETDTIQPFLDDILQASGMASDLCRQMLVYTGKSLFEPMRIDLATEISELSHLIHAAQSPNQKVIHRFPAEPVMVLADPSQIRQVVMNLVTNSIDALGDGGEIIVSTGFQELDPASLDHAVVLDESTGPGVFAFITVVDSGQGMDQHTLTHLFDPFFTTKSSGRGLGLSSVLGIVRQHRGLVTVQSQLSMGTEFNVYIPAEEGTGAIDLSTLKSKLLGMGSGNVLLAEDDPQVSTVCQRMLEAQGYDVTAVEDGAQGLALFRENPDIWTCTLLDISMPSLDGDQLLEEMHRMRPELPAVFMSGFRKESVAKIVENHSRVVFLQKPFTNDQMNHALNKILHESINDNPND